MQFALPAGQALLELRQLPGSVIPLAKRLAVHVYVLEGEHGVQFALFSGSILLPLFGVQRYALAYGEDVLVRVYLLRHLL